MVLVDSSIWMSALAPGSQSYLYKVKLEALLSRYQVCITDAIRFEILQNVAQEKRSLCLEYLSFIPSQAVKASTWNIAITVAWEMRKHSVILDQGKALTVAVALQNRLYFYTIDESQLSVGEHRRLKLIG
jgi:predicted nucleic acid-binding protein